MQMAQFACRSAINRRVRVGLFSHQALLLLLTTAFKNVRNSPTRQWAVCSSSNHTCLAERTLIRPLLLPPYDYNATCHNISHALNVFDLSCNKAAGGGIENAWHVIRSCLIPISPLIAFTREALLSCTPSGAATTRSVALIPSTVWKYVHILFKPFYLNQAQIFVYNQSSPWCIKSIDKSGKPQSDCKSGCHNINGAAIVYSEIEEYRNSPRSAEFLFAAGQNLLQPSEAGTRSHRPLAIMINRQNRQNRSICHFHDVFMPLLRTHFPSFEFIFYNGTESTSDTIRLFAQPSVKLIVGYHGAGHANAVFSPPGTLVVEFAFSHPLASTALYISQVHQLCEVRTGLRCFSIKVDPTLSFNRTEFERLRPLFNGNLRPWQSPGFSQFHYATNCVNITVEDVRSMQVALKDELLSNPKNFHP